MRKLLARGRFDDAYAAASRYVGLDPDHEVALELSGELDPGVADAVVVGVPDEKFGEAITAVVEMLPGSTLDEAALIAHVKGHLAHFKSPKRVLGIDTIGRAPNGKVDYKRLKAYAMDELGIDA